MTSKHRYCLTAEGEVVFADDARAVELLVGEGCEVEDHVAAKYGFDNGEVKPKTMAVESKEGKAEVVTAKESGAKAPSKK